MTSPASRGWACSDTCSRTVRRVETSSGHPASSSTRATRTRRPTRYESVEQCIPGLYALPADEEGMAPYARVYDWNNGYEVAFCDLKGEGAPMKFEEDKNCISYMKSKLARSMPGVLKVTQDMTPAKITHGPLQDFTDSCDIDWSQLPALSTTMPWQTRRDSHGHV